MHIKLCIYNISRNSYLLVTDADLHGDVDGPELSGDDRSIASDIHDATEAHFDNDSMDSDKEALNLVNYLILYIYIYISNLFYSIEFMSILFCGNLKIIYFYLNLSL